MQKNDYYCSMKAISIITIFLFITSFIIAQNPINIEMQESHYVDLIKTAFYTQKVSEINRKPFLKYLRHRKELLKIQHSDTLRYIVSTQLTDTINQRMVVQISCENMSLSEINSDGRNILALIDIKTNSLISILGNNNSTGFSEIQWTADFMIAYQFGWGLSAWHRITGEPQGQVFSGHTHNIKAYENSNEVFIIVCETTHHYPITINLEPKK